MSYIVTNNSATIFHEGNVRTIASTHVRFSDVVELVKTGTDEDLAKAIELIDLSKAVAKKIEEDNTDGLSVRNGRVYYNDYAIPDALSKRIVTMSDEGYNLNSMVEFVKNLLANPSYRAQHELYTFLESNDLPITTDGHFMAYKRVSDKLMDVHSGTIDNSIGRIVSMPRSAVNDDCTQTCSPGLHVASLGYLKHYSGSRLVAVKVNPRNVVSVPIDYQNSKMRVCEYTVVKELDISLVYGDEDAEEYQRSVYEEDDNDDYDDYFCESEDDPEVSE